MNHFAVEEYDRYGRPFLDLGHCRYKGGHSSTTTVQQRNIPAQTAREAALEGDLYRYSTQGINQSQDYLNRANNAINNLPQYDWSALQRNYERKADSALNNYNNALRWGTNNYQINLQNNNRSYQNKLNILDALGNQATSAYQNRQNAQASAYENAMNAASNRAWAGQNAYQNQQNAANTAYQNALAQGNAEYSRNAQDYTSAQSAAQNAYQRDLQDITKAYGNAANTFGTNQQAANGTYQRALDAANQGIAQTTDAYQRDLGSLRDAYNQRVAAVNNGYADLLAGKLPSTYAAARQAALKDDLEKSMGSTVSNMASRGIMNSSVTSRALNDISQNASDTLAKQYTNDLQTAADLLSRGNNQYENWFGNNLKAYEGAYNAGVNRYNAAATNAGNAYNAATGMNKSVLDAANNYLANRQTNAGNTYSAATGTNKGILDAWNGATGARMTNAGNAYNAGTNTNKSIYDSYMGNVDRDRENAKNNYSVQSESNKSVLDALRANIASRTTNAANSLTANNAAAKGIYDAANNYGKTQYDSTVQNLKDRINVANVTQNAGLALPAAYLGYANQLYSPAQNLYNNMYNGRMGTGTTSSSTSQSGPSTSSQMWGLAGTLGAASIIACFTAGTLITTPDGYKEIRSIKEGDVVLSLDAEDNPVTKKVASVNGPKEQEIWDLEFDNGIILHTTRAQRFYCAPFFEFFPQIYANGMTVVERDGGHAHIIRMHNTGRKEMVYDFTLEGSRAKNIFFANDVAVEGF